MVYESSKVQPVARPVRTRHAGEGSIKSVWIENGMMKIRHSVLGASKQHLI